MAQLIYFIVYILVIFVFNEFFNFLDQNTQTLFELAYFTAGLLIFKDKIVFRFKLSRSLGIILLLNLLLGSLTFFIAKKSLIVPFDLTDNINLLWLFLIGPVVEELVFRHSLLESSKRFLKLGYLPVILTSVLFSYAHFRSVFAFDSSMASIIHFIYFQTFYTLCLGLWWGHLKVKWNSLLIPILAHILFNLGFGISGILTAEKAPQVQEKKTKVEEKKIKILIVDSKLDGKLLKSYFGNEINARVSILENAIVPEYLDPNFCQKTLEGLEGLVDTLMFHTGKTSDYREEAYTLTKVSAVVHPYHILGLVQKDLSSDFHIGLLGLNPPPHFSELKNVDAYMNKFIDEEFLAIEKAIEIFSPRIVNLSASESFSITREELILLGKSKDIASKVSNKLMTKIEKHWRRILSKHPGVTFVASAGNGGHDFISDNIESGRTHLPGGLNYSNLVIATSKAENNCISPFSNYGEKNVHVAAKGENVNSLSPCPSKFLTKLSGASQATAKVSNYLARSFQKGMSLKSALDSLPTSKCLKGKVKNSKYLP